MNEEIRRPDSGRETTGLIIILIGFGLLMNSLNILPFSPLLSRYWLPILLIAIGLIHLSRARGSDGWAGGVFWIGIGALLFIARLPYFNVNVFRLIGPAIVIWIGVSLLMKGSRTRSVRSDYSRDAADAAAGGGVSLDSGDSVSATAILGGFNRKSTSRQFKGGDLTTIMGGGKLDLRDAGIQAEGAVLDVFTLMGAIEIIVPQDWIVESRVTPILGGYENKTHPNKEADKRLAIQGTSLMGSIVVKT